MPQEPQPFDSSSQVNEALTSSKDGGLKAYTAVIDNCWSPAALQEVIIFVGLYDRNLLHEVAGLVNTRRHELIRMKKEKKVRVPVSVEELDSDSDSYEATHPLVSALLTIAANSNQDQ